MQGQVRGRNDRAYDSAGGSGATPRQNSYGPRRAEGPSEPQPTEENTYPDGCGDVPVKLCVDSGIGILCNFHVSQNILRLLLFSPTILKM